MKVGKWDLLLLALLVSPFAIGSVFIHSMHGLLTVEVVPADQGSVPTPSEGDLVEIYGTWVYDGNHPFTTGWNEIHPAVYLRNLTAGAEGGTQQCKLLAGVHDPERLRILDPTEPCKLARGKVQFIFVFSDGDIHLDLLLDSQYQYLANTGPPLLTIAFPTAVVLLALSTAGFGTSYAWVSVIKPRRTLAGQIILKLLGSDRANPHDANANANQ